MPKITVVFDYSEGAELPNKLTAAFASESTAFEDATITAISMEDEISRVEKLENMDVSATSGDINTASTKYNSVILFLRSLSDSLAFQIVCLIAIVILFFVLMFSSKIGGAIAVGIFIFGLMGVDAWNKANGRI